MSTIINTGQQRPMTVLKAVGGKEQPRKPAVSVVRNGNTDVFKLVQEGMAGTTAGTRYGTAIHEIGPMIFPVRTGGKTGTAENGRSFKDGYAYTHAWYEGYGPIGKDGQPTFAVVAFFQNGGEGSGPALRAVKRMFAARWCVKLDERLSALPSRNSSPAWANWKICAGSTPLARHVSPARRSPEPGPDSSWAP
ncbi:penicillin-binding transpeptidase domain-containing protein [Deinococcus malanensis]|uniref:penicillin-binding transpeptidase domain-containing protein n=1 Tax=Deinococcus malanensis TaxID=1706855 RepID=UPI00363499A9